MGLFTLPAGYGHIRTLNLVNERRPAFTVSITALAIGVGAILLGRLHLPLAALVRWGDIPATLLSFTLLIAGFILYVIGHELVHGLFIRIFSGKRATFGFNWLYAYAGSEGYFTKGQYTVIALAPVAMFGALFLALALLLPPEWFWHAQLLQAYNLAGAAGDYYVVALAAKMPRGLLVRDTGFTMDFYAPQQ